MVCRCLAAYAAGWSRGGRLPRNSATPAAGAQSFYEVGCWHVSLGQQGKMLNVDPNGDFCQGRLFFRSNTRYANRVSGKTVPGRRAAPPSERS